jgi:hypothetical protein
MTVDLSAVELPGQIHAEILIAIDTVTDSLVTRGVVWADRTYRVCGTCREPVPTVPRCPVAINGGDGQGAQLGELSQRHSDLGGSCGIWQPVLWAECGASEDGITAAATAMVAERAESVRSAREQMTAMLRKELADAMQRLREGADADKITTGSDGYPGVYLDTTNTGQWVVWDYDPGDISEKITVYASDLADG